MAGLKLTDINGNVIKTTGSPMSGGEGDVYNIDGEPNLVVKVYNDKKKSNKDFNALISKLQLMCDICDNSLTQKAAWPQKIVYLNGEPVGFVMNKIMYSSEFHQLTDDIDRKEKFLDNNWKYLLLVAYNLACAFKTLHDKGIIIGDINERNFLIGNRTLAEENGDFNFKENGIVYSIDCDSFQIIKDDKQFLCTVKTWEYFPPELHNSNLHKVIRTQNHDNFGLAILIFQLLMLGKHPYSGAEEPQVSIKKGNYVFCEDAIQKGIQVLPMDLQIFNSLNNEIKLLFKQAFSNEPNIKRPSAEDWIKALMRQMDDLVQCPNNKNHYYNKNGNCIWCEIEKESGYNPFEHKVNSNFSQMAYNFVSSTPPNKSSTNNQNSLNYQSQQNISSTTTTNNTVQVQPNNQTVNNFSKNFDTWVLFTSILSFLVVPIGLLLELFKNIFSFVKVNSLWGVIAIIVLMKIITFLPCTSDTIDMWLTLLFIVNFIKIIYWGIKKQKPFLTVLFTIMMFIIAGLLFDRQAPNTNLTAKNISQINEERNGSHGEKTENTDILKEIIEEEIIISQYLKSSNSQQNKDTEFLEFYHNLDRLSDKYYPISQYESLKQPLTKDDYFDNREIKYHTIVKNNKITGIEITSPATNLYRFHIDDHTFYFYPVINAEYLKHTYGQYLSQSVNDFLQLQIEFYKDLNMTVYSNVINEWYEGEKYPFPNKELLLNKWIKEYEKFLQKYPDFPLKGAIKNYISAFKNQTNIDKSDNLDNNFYTMPD